MGAARLSIGKLSRTASVSMAGALCAVFLFAQAFAAPSLGAAEPVRHLAIYVEPFYRAADTPAGSPHVQVHSAYDRLLASNALADIEAARAAIAAKPALSSPMTLMVLAIRYYDLGARDEAVFWFYVAKDRMASLLEVTERNTPALAQATHAIGAFSQLAGPAINGYAFCDLDNQRKQREAAFRWVEANPYQAVFLEKIPARGQDRKALLAAALASIRTQVDKEQSYLADPANLEKFRNDRRKNDADAKFCWR